MTKEKEAALSGSVLAQSEVQSLCWFLCVVVSSEWPSRPAQNPSGRRPPGSSASLLLPVLCRCGRTFVRPVAACLSEKIVAMSC